MIDAPVALVLIGPAMQAAGPIHRVVSRAIGDLTLQDRIAAADAELASDPEIAGIAAIAEIYRRG